MQGAIRGQIQRVLGYLSGPGAPETPLIACAALRPERQQARACQPELRVQSPPPSPDFHHLVETNIFVCSVLCLCGGDEAATDVGEVAVLALQSSLITRVLDGLLCGDGVSFVTD